MKNYEVMQLCKTIVSRRIQSLEEELNSIFDLLGKEESEAPQESGARLKMSIEPEHVLDRATIVLDNTELKAPVPKKALGKPLRFDDSMFLTVNPIYNRDDYIDEVAVLFSKSCKDLDFIDFFTSFNFFQVLSNAKYYSLDIAKQLYCSMTGASYDSFDVLAYLNKKEYFTGVIAYKRDTFYAFNAKGFNIIQENIKKHQDYKSVFLRNCVTGCTILSKKEFPPPPTIPDFLTRVIDLEKVSSDNLGISDLADIYAKTYGKKVDDRIIRNALVAKHITVISVFGDKRPARGEALSEMLRRYRKLRSSYISDEKPYSAPSKPSDGLCASIGELMKDKLKTTLNK